LDTEKKITPTEFAQNRFYNFNDDFSTVKIYSQDTELETTDKEYSTVDYIEYSAGNTNITIKSQGEIILNSLTNFHVNNKYTTIFFGNAERPKLIILDDNITTNSTNNFYLRLVNITNNVITYELNQDKNNLSKSNNTDFIELDQNSTFKINDSTISLLGFANGQEYTYIYSDKIVYLID